MRALIQIFLAILISTALAMPSFADDSGSSTAMTGTRKQLATIIFTGLGGAVLGLSTLSFYGRPQDNMANIAIGFAAGIIIGTIYVTVKTATNPGDFTSTLPLDPTSRESADLARYALAQPTTLQLGWKF